MALILPNSVFLHVPKTGGEWVRAAIVRAGVPARESNRGDTPHGRRMHSNLLTTRGMGRWCPEFRSRPWTWLRARERFKFAFVRDPVSWYQSRWAYKMKTGWDATDEIDRACEDDDFVRSTRRLLAFRPHHVTDLFELYTGREEGVIDFTGRFENLADDLVTALRRAGEKFDEEALRSTPAANVASRSDEFRARCACPDDLRREIVLSEERIMRRFGYPIEVAEAAPRA